MPSKKPTASKPTETPLAARDEVWIVEAWTIAGKLRAAGQRTKAERMEDAAERAQLALDGLDVPRKSRDLPNESTHATIARVVVRGIRDGYGLDWATRYAGIGLTDHRALWARSEIYRGMFGTLDPNALPIDARPKPLPERVPFVGRRPAMTEAAPAR